MSTTSAVDAAVRGVLGRLAPEADLGSLAPDDDLQETLDLDSMDFLSFVIGVKEATGVEVPERDYPQVATLAGCIDYVVARSPG
jgi:acyl carrier protein